LWLEGYRTVKQKVYLTRDNTFKIKYRGSECRAGESPGTEASPIAPPEGEMQPRSMRRPEIRGTMKRRSRSSRERRTTAARRRARGTQGMPPRGGKRNAAYWKRWRVKCNPATQEVVGRRRELARPARRISLTVEGSC